MSRKLYLLRKSDKRTFRGNLKKVKDTQETRLENISRCSSIFKEQMKKHKKKQIKTHMYQSACLQTSSSIIRPFSLNNNNRQQAYPKGENEENIQKIKKNRRIEQVLKERLQKQIELKKQAVIQVSTGDETDRMKETQSSDNDCIFIKKKGRGNQTRLFKPNNRMNQYMIIQPVDDLLNKRKGRNFQSFLVSKKCLKML